MPRNTSVTIGEHFSEFVSEKIDEGRFESVSEVVRAGLRLLEADESRLALLREKLAKGKQQAAMQALANYVFAGDTLTSMNPLYSYMQHQRRGFNHYNKNEDPKAHDMILHMQKSKWMRIQL